MPKRSSLRWLAIVGAAVAVLGAAWGLRSGPKGQGEFFYDLSEKRLFAAPRAAFAPIAGVGGPAGDGVEAVCVHCPVCGVKSKRIAYLRTHTPGYKQRQDAADQTGAPIPDLTREYIEQNTLVRRLDSEDWHAASTPEGAKIVTGWRGQCAEHGEYERPLRP